MVLKWFAHFNTVQSHFIFLLYFDTFNVHSQDKFCSKQVKYNSPLNFNPMMQVQILITPKFAVGYFKKAESQFGLVQG